MQLPYEDEVRLEIQAKLKPELDLASEILDLGTGIFTSDREMQLGPGLDDFVIAIGLGLVAKACKQFRAIGHLVEMGLGDDADGVARMLFETMLAASFILRRRVSLKRNGARVPPVA